MIEISSEEELLSLIKGSKGNLFIFKHSTYCPISAMAFADYEEFSSDHPDIPCALIIIQQNRNISNKLEEISGVEHESPQVIHYFAGNVKWNASHRAIRKEILEKQIKEKA
jgi:bacillithiol system protein YtxJ